MKEKRYNETIKGQVKKAKSEEKKIKGFANF